MAAFRHSLTVVCALLLSGCFYTKDEPFSLDTGSKLENSNLGLMSCLRYKKDGRPELDDSGAQRSGKSQLVLIQRNKRYQYVLVENNTSSIPPFTLHLAKAGQYVVAYGVEDSPGQLLYAARVAGDSLTFYTFDNDADTKGRARRLAQKHGIMIEKSKGYWDMSGPVPAQKAFLLEMASDLSDWSMSIKCVMLKKPD